MIRDYRQVNRDGWAYLSEHGSDSSQPYGPELFPQAREWLDPKGWISWKEVQSVLCLACGGGQQAPLFASLGCHVTLVDLSPQQLQRDIDVAKQHGFQIECLEADMLDLSPLYGRQFDLVYQAISACYVPDVRRLYREVRRVTKLGGHYRVEHWNPTHIQLPDVDPWDGEAYRIARVQCADEPVQWTSWHENQMDATATCWHFIHPLDSLIGGLCDAGFAIVRFAETRAGDAAAEPGTHEHLAAYLPPFFAIFAERLSILGEPGDD